MEEFGRIRKCPLCKADLPTEGNRCDTCGANIEHTIDYEQTADGLRKKEIFRAVNRTVMSGPPVSVPPELHRTGSYRAGIRFVRDSNGGSKIYVQNPDGSETHYDSVEQLPPEARKMYERIAQIRGGREPDLTRLMAERAPFLEAQAYRKVSCPARRTFSRVLTQILAMIIPALIITYGIHGFVTGHMLVPRGRYSGKFSQIGGEAAYALAAMVILSGLWLHFGYFWRNVEATRSFALVAEKVFLVAALIAFAVFAFFMIF